MYHWGFALMAAIPMIVGALVLRRVLFGKDGNLRQTFIAVALTWVIAAVIGALWIAGGDVANADWAGSLIGYLKPTVLVAVILGAMAFVRTKA